jgi:hypothetical protein
MTQSQPRCQCPYINFRKYPSVEDEVVESEKFEDKSVEDKH